MTAANPYYLEKGNHKASEGKRCAMEWVAFIAGEPHSDHPVCVSPLLQSFCIAFNDRLGDEDRQKLRPYLARCIGTAGDGLDEQRRQILREWLVRTAAPDWLELAGKTEAAQRLRDLPDALVQENTLRLIREARHEAQSARDEARRKLRKQLEARFGATDAYAAAADAYAAAADAYAAAAAADAYAAAYAAAAADAYAAAAAAAAAADAYAAAAAAAAAAADAYAAAAADAYAAAADAYAAAAADAYAADAPSLSAFKQSVYTTVRAKVTERLQPIADRHNAQGFELLDRMLPKIAIDLPEPVAERALEVCRV